MESFEQGADAVHFGLAEEPFLSSKSQIAEPKGLEAGSIDHPAAGELIEAFVAEADLGGALDRLPVADVLRDEEAQPLG